MLGALFPAAPTHLASRDITGVTADSRHVKPGFLFVAVPGIKADGAQFIADALTRGAATVITESVIHGSDAVITVPDARLALAQAAAAFFPQQPKTIVAVTGTSGKTSVADFTRQLFDLAGQNGASIGTLGVVRTGHAAYGSLTTPDPVSLHETLAVLARDGVQHVAMEASSHGLDQKRLDGVKLHAAGFTNLGHDHLDYHPTMADYLTAKMRLFRELLPVGHDAIINADCAQADEVARIVQTSGRHAVMVGKKGGDICLTGVVRDGFYQSMRIGHAGATHETQLRLLGDFQAQNAMVAAGLAISAGLDPRAVFKDFENLAGVPGRLEVVGEARGGIVLVDYAHKPEALEAALTTLRPFARGKLKVAFGCGGDRDKTKRPIMGEIAARIADEVIVTDDNPRSENPAAIRAAILADAPHAREIGDRRTAIFDAVQTIGPGDVVLIAGKGHETGQTIGNRTEPFSDKDVAQDAIRSLT
ncbi:MAG: UDP-N-acetylmuramoyl-L-alanyl-D-glutamate--2,6-diaminopimelate ligase [Beijerinckiaceae bacterium]